MTAQMADNVEFEGATWSLTGVSGDGLFEPEAVGLRPAMISTACWRGYVCTYAVRDGRLVLAELLVGPLSELHGERISPGAVLLGAGAQWSETWGAHRFPDLALPMPFSGTLLLGDDFVSRHYVHMGFHPGWKYRRVVELVVEDGAVTASHDRSAEVARVRQAVEDGEIEDPDGPRRAAGWVGRTFRLGYDRTFGDG